MDLEKLADRLYRFRYLDHTTFLDDKELKKLLEILIRKAGDNWRLVQSKNVETDEVWYELDLQEDWSGSSCQTVEWLNYSR